MGLGTRLVTEVILIIILMIVVFTVLAETASDIGDAADNITAQNDVLPLTSFFRKKGVILLVLMAGIALTFIVGLLDLVKTTKK